MGNEFQLTGLYIGKRKSEYQRFFLHARKTCSLNMPTQQRLMRWSLGRPGFSYSEKKHIHDNSQSSIENVPKVKKQKDDPRQSVYQARKTQER